MLAAGKGSQFLPVLRLLQRFGSGVEEQIVRQVALAQVTQHIVPLTKEIGGRLRLSVARENALLIATDTGVRCKIRKIVSFSMAIASTGGVVFVFTLGSLEVSKVPHELADEKVLLPQGIECLKVLTEHARLIVLRPDVRRKLQMQKSVTHEKPFRRTSSSPGISPYHMESFHRIGTVLGHQNGLVVHLVPGLGLLYHPIGDHVKPTSVRVPRIVPVKANDIEMLSLQKRWHSDKKT